MRCVVFGFVGTGDFRRIGFVRRESDKESKSEMNISACDVI